MDMKGKTRVLILGLLLGFIVLHLVLANRYYFLTDDAFISFRYLENWLSGDGLVFNPGERVEGYTNFLWIVLLALPAALGMAPETAAPLFSIIASACLLFLVFFARVIALEEKPVSWSWVLAPLFLVLMRTYSVWATGGLETRLFSLLIFCGALLAFRAIKYPQGWWSVFASLAFGLSELTRPEGLLFFATAAALVFAGRLALKNSLIHRRDLAGLGLFALIVGAHFLARYIYYGSWLPNTFYAKVAGQHFDQGISYLSLFCLEYAFYFWAVPLIFFIYHTVRSKDLFAYFFFIFPLPYILYVTYLGGDHFEYRFLDPVLPAVAIILTHGIIRWVFPKGIFHKKRIIPATAFCLLFIIYQQAIPWASSMAFGPQYKTAVVPEIDPSKTAFRYLPGFNYLASIFTRNSRPLIRMFAGIRWEEHKAFWQKQAEHGRSFKGLMQKGLFKPSDLFCMPYIGALPYYSNIKVVDFHGLIDPVIARSDSAKSRPLFHARTPPEDYIQKRGVEFLVTGGDLITKDDAPGLPWLHTEQGSKDFSEWTKRRYVARLDELYMIFFSTKPPEEISARFKSHGYQVYIYVPEQGSLMRPLELGVWLKNQ
jgi:hypothetical protein